MNPLGERKLDVLIVDDDPFVRDSLQLFLESEGIDVRVAACGEDAISILHDSEPDVALVDLRMPRMNGLEVLREFKRISPEIEVVMATGDATLESALSAMKLGAYTYIEKPIVDLERDLLGVLIRAAERRSLRRTNRQLQGELQLTLHHLEAERREKRFSRDSFPIARFLRKCASASCDDLKSLILNKLPGDTPALLYLRQDRLLVPGATRSLDLPPVEAGLPAQFFTDPGEKWRVGELPEVFGSDQETLMLPLFWLGHLVGMIALPRSKQLEQVDPGHQLLRRIADTASALLGSLISHSSTPTG